MHKVAAIDALSGGVKLFHRCRNGAAETQRHAQGQRLDQREDDLERYQTVAIIVGHDAAQRATEELVVQPRRARVHLDGGGELGGLVSIPVGSVEGREKVNAEVADIDRKSLGSTKDGTVMGAASAIAIAAGPGWRAACNNLSARAGGSQSREVHAAQPFCDQVQQRAIDGQAGDDGDKAATRHAPLVDGNEVEVFAVEHQLAKLLAIDRKST